VGPGAGFDGSKRDAIGTHALALDGKSGVERRVRSRRPRLPRFLPESRIMNLGVAGATADLLLVRDGNDVGVDVLRRVGDLAVVVADGIGSTPRTSGDDRMPKSGPPRRRKILRAFEAGPRRRAILAVLMSWNRNQSSRVGVFILLAWLAGTLGIHLAERGANPAFDTLGESLWSAWVLLFSGVEIQPTTTLGRLFAMVLVVSGIGFVGLFTGTVASILVEAHLRRRDVERIALEGHLVICHWAPRGMQLIRELHGKLTTTRRPVIIIDEHPESIVLPDAQEDPVFDQVYIVKGDPINEVILRRAKVAKAFSVVILADDREERHADGKSVVTCLAVRNVCRGEGQPSVVVECRNPDFRPYLTKAGADEIISPDELGLRLMARTALFHGMTRVYQELLTVGRDANEMYLIAAPEILIGRDFVELNGLFARHRDGKQSCLLIGIQRGDQMHLNPIGGEAGPLEPGDGLILLSRVILDPSRALPTNPPMDRPATTDG